MNHNKNYNKENLQTELQAVMGVAIGEVLHDYKTLFASSPKAKADGGEANFLTSSLTDEDFVGRHKIGKIVLSHLEAVLKIYEGFCNPPPSPPSPHEKNNGEEEGEAGRREKLIDEARASLKGTSLKDTSLKDTSLRNKPAKNGA